MVGVYRCTFFCCQVSNRITTTFARQEQYGKGYKYIPNLREIRKINKFLLLRNVTLKRMKHIAMY